VSYHGSVILHRQRCARLVTAVVIALVFPCLSSSQLQHAVDEALRTPAGTIVVVDLTSGKLLASKNLDLAAKHLIRPGSTLKPFVLQELLRTKRIDSQQRLLCRRPLRIGTSRLDCSHAPEVKQLNAAEALAYSCNSYMAEVSTRLSNQELPEALRRAGLDSPTGLLDGEAVGHINSVATREHLQLMALGLRGIEVTPLELLAAYRKLALQLPRAKELGTEAIYEGLENAVAYGTAHAAFVPNLKIAGKTGTASSAQIAITHGLFVGYAPAERPEVAIVVYLEHSRGLDAAAVAQSVLAQYKPSEKTP
jgi:cell division protein FtsI/penicillin-binding protein 2